MARVIIIRSVLGQQVVLYNRTSTICRTCYIDNARVLLLSLG
jgi:hypothetical protein